jgi:PadR family transcriptional regulator, regulatory protein PadR
LTYLGKRGSHIRVIRSQLLKGTVPFLVLSVLAEGELYGYQIAQRIRERSGAFLAPSEGSLYPALHRLERDGAVAAEWRAGELGPRRRYYTLTPSGKKLLAEAREEWRAFTGIVSAVAGEAAS